MVAPPKLTDIKEDVEEIIEPLQLSSSGIRHMIRGINAQNQFGTDGSKPLAVIEDEINSMFAQGFKLELVQHLRSNFAPEGNMIMSEQMLYVFLKE